MASSSGLTLLRRNTAQLASHATLLETDAKKKSAMKREKECGTRKVTVSGEVSVKLYKAGEDDSNNCPDSSLKYRC